MLFTIAKPVWNDGAGEAIEAFRATHDPQHDLLAAHFTLAFGLAADLAVWRPHVQKVTSSKSPFRFVLRHAMLFALDKERAHVFLVPDEGASQLARLYGDLHMDGWAKYRRLDIPYIPHITVAVASRADQAQAWVEEWNNETFELAGQIDVLSIGEIREGRFVTLAQEALGTDA